MDAGSSQVPANSQLKLDLRKLLQHVWHFDKFRAGQADAIRQAIEGQSTLLSLATGAGKSLAYQLPALVLWAAYGTLTLVVTPLLSLMRDQMQQLPPGMLALSMSSEKELQSDVAAQLLSGKVQLLFVSPERLQSRRFQEMMASDGMPRVQLAVVDEAHCADEWSHSFRPAYLQLARQLQRLGTQCVLAMTGTATATLTRRLCKMFSIDPESGVVRGPIVRENIELSVVAVDMSLQPRGRSTAREDALVELLRTPGMAQLDSIIVYVATQASADRIAEYLTVRSLPAQSYHAGKTASERARIQAAFMHKPDAGALAIRVLVATVAFGMGLNKHDVRAVVHFNLPRSMEAYVQETGRAGRDGGPARGVLLLA
ncbi:P-loop containing nucleoside triphosphate hydrolase protein, partial [Coemansia mojavensis]